MSSVLQKIKDDVVKYRNKRTKKIKIELYNYITHAVINNKQYKTKTNLK